MRILLGIIFLLWVNIGAAQNPNLAKNYFDQGEFEKSLAVYESLTAAQPGRLDYFLGMIQSLQQLEKYQQAEDLLKERLRKTTQFPQLYVELGHNYALQNQSNKAQDAYSQALVAIETNSNYTYTIANTFQHYNLLNEAVEAYEKGMSLNPNMDFNMQLAQIYGEQGKLEKMFETYLNLVEKNEGFKHTAQRYFSMYVTEDGTNEANDVLRRVLLKRAQQTQALMYNEFLSWLFIQQKEFKKALVQEKAIHKRNEENLNRLTDLAKITISEKDFQAAQETITYIIDNALTPQQRLQGQQMLLEIEVVTATQKQFPEIKKKFDDLLTEYGKGMETYLLQIDYNHFLAFKLNKKEEAISNLKTLLKERMNNFQEAQIKMELADILVLDEKFNQALIFYSQVQSKVQNDALSQEARFKVARTSYFKGDFDWALNQLDVLKKSTSQLIANDAMQLSLLIKDNSLMDSTQTALKKYARADLLVLQEKYPEAIAALDEILTMHKGESIEDEALLKQGTVLEIMGQYTRATENYLKIIQYYGDDILADDALFRLASLFETKLDQPEKAKQYYEKIIFDHADSIYFVEARRKYRTLRGDLIN